MKNTSERLERVKIHDIAGGYRLISVYQMALAGWLFTDGHITKRQLRVYWAAHEMAETRQAAENARRKRPGRQKPMNARYGLAEIRQLVGGRSSQSADRALRGDVKALSRVGLVHIKSDSITFAESADQINVELWGFWLFLEQIPNQKRMTYIPRRTVRAMAGGFSSSVMSLMMGLVIRSLFYNRQDKSFSIDGRTKLQWVADTFKLSRRSVTTAYAKLIELGWLTPIETDQWKLNRWGQRCQINVNTFGKTPQSNEGQSASPSAENEAQLSSPDQTDNYHLRDNNKHQPAEHPDQKHVDSSKDKKQKAPVLERLEANDLAQPERLLDVYAQCVKRGFIGSSEHERFRFICLAQRALAEGRRAGALFVYLLKKRKWEYITQADEDQARQVLSDYHNGTQNRTPSTPKTPTYKLAKMSENDAAVATCLKVATVQRTHPATLAFKLKKWTPNQWQSAYEVYQENQAARWRD